MKCTFPWYKKLLKCYYFQGVPGEGRFATTEQLSQAITSIIFASTVGHAAVNVSQYDEYAFLPNYPAILKGNPPRDKVGHASGFFKHNPQSRKFLL